MAKFLAIVALAALCCGSSEALYDNLPMPNETYYDFFPTDFRWGFATAAYQIEGGWNADGKGPNIWDTFTRQSPSPIFDGSSGDDACKSYEFYKEDVQLIKNMGANYYRFSVGWSRVIPTGIRSEGVNEAGVQYYSNLIDELLSNDIEPMITLYHWDLPQGLQDWNGWLNETVVDHFKNYADLLFERFGDRVKTWITFNEAWVFCVQGHGDGIHAPGMKVPATAPYQCVHNVLKSHAEAYHLYYDTYNATQGGKVGITVDSGWYEPEDPSNPEHEAAALRAVTFKHGWIFSPIYRGDYPQVMKDYVADKSAQDGLPSSRLPEFSEAEKQRIRGTWDFLGLNHYTTELVQPADRSDRSWYGDQNTTTRQSPDWPESASSWLKDVPWGFRKLLNWIKDEYNNPLVYVTENGFSDLSFVGLNDDNRITYYNGYINNMLKAARLDGCNVKSYTAWSLMDNFEWARGYSERFGIHFVDYTNPNRTRTPKKSAGVIREIFATNGFVQP